jgi:aspartate-semialdehyde dehydrogenase
MHEYKVAIIGATGNVGRAICDILAKRKFSKKNIIALASQKSNGKEVGFGEGDILKVKGISSFNFKDAQIVIIAAGSRVARDYRQNAIESGCIIIDTSSAFRMEEGVPLVIPDVNTEALKDYVKKRIIASPNCTTAQLVMAIKPLYDLYGIKRIVASTYQSVSGAGKFAMEELYRKTKGYFEAVSMGQDEKEEVDPESSFTKNIAFNCIPQIDDFMEDGRTKEEWKMEVETRKILENPNLEVSATCVRVPVFTGHAVSANIEFEKPFDFDELYEALSDFEGIVLLDRREDGGYATHRDIIRAFGVFVSRVRLDPSRPNSLNMWITADNVYGIGAAYNAVRILEELIKIL